MQKTMKRGRGRPRKAVTKEPITIRIMPAVKEFFSNQAELEGGSYQSLIHDVLAEHVADNSNLDDTKRVALLVHSIKLVLAELENPASLPPSLLECLEALREAEAAFDGVFPPDDEE